VRRALVAIVLVACSGPSPGTTNAPRALDQAAYDRDVQPIVEARCATLDCHGHFDRPLRLYAETGLRRSDELRGLPITAQELADNVAAAAAIDDSLILDKALGAMKHTGGALFTGTDDPQYVCVRGWLVGASADAAVASACAIAATQVALPPP
jgi:hypothetical protein